MQRANTSSMSARTQTPCPGQSKIPNTAKSQPQATSLYSPLKTNYHRFSVKVHRKISALQKTVTSNLWLVLLPILAVSFIYFIKWITKGSETITADDLSYIVRNLREEIKGIKSNPSNKAAYFDQKLEFLPSKLDSETSRKLEFMVHELRMEMKGAFSNMADCEAESHFSLTQVVLAVIVFVLMALCAQHVLSEKEQTIRLEERHKRDKKMREMQEEMGRQHGDAIRAMQNQFCNELKHMQLQLTNDKLQDQLHTEHLFIEAGRNCQQMFQAQITAAEKQAIEWQSREEKQARAIEAKDRELLEREKDEHRGGILTRVWKFLV